MNPKDIIKKWKDSGLLDGLSGTTRESGLADLLQCCASKRLNEKNVVFPIIKQIMNKLPPGIGW